MLSYYKSEIYIATPLRVVSQKKKFAIFSEKRLTHPTDWTLRYMNEGAQGRIYGSLVGEILSHVRREQDEVRSLLIAGRVLTTNAALQLC